MRNALKSVYLCELDPGFEITMKKRRWPPDCKHYLLYLAINNQSVIIIYNDLYVSIVLRIDDDFVLLNQAIENHFHLCFPIGHKETEHNYQHQLSGSASRVRKSFYWHAFGIDSFSIILVWISHIFHYLCKNCFFNYWEEISDSRHVMYLHLQHKCRQIQRKSSWTTHSELN